MRSFREMNPMPTAVSSSSKPDQVRQVAAESIKPPIHQRLYLAPPRGRIRSSSAGRDFFAPATATFHRPRRGERPVSSPFGIAIWGVARNLSTSFTRGLR
jgi:hypothetical protein